MIMNCLVIGRFILRYSYGKSFDSIDSVKCEELDPLRIYDSILWGNSAIAGTLILLKPQTSHQIFVFAVNTVFCSRFLRISEFRSATHLAE